MIKSHTLHIFNVDFSSRKENIQDHIFRSINTYLCIHNYSED